MNPEFHKYTVLLVIVFIFFSLFKEIVRPAISFLIGALVLLVLGVISPEDFLTGFANKSIATIILLILISSAFRKNFDVKRYFDQTFKNAKSPRKFLALLMASVASLSSIINNTPVVAMMTPYVYDWGKKHNVAPSKLLIPLSYATILGGMITVIGTSTNLVVNGFISENGQQILTYTDFLYLGLIVTFSGLVFLVVAGYRMLPNNQDTLDAFQEHPKEYIVETILQKSSPLVGKTVAEAKLRNLKGVYLVDILRNGETISPVSPDEKLLGRDVLIFAGDTYKIVDLFKKDNGIVLPKHGRILDQKQLNVVETVIPYNSYLSGKLVKESDFRQRYQAAIIAIHRNGERVKGKIGDMHLATGDLLLLTTSDEFFKINERTHDFFIVSRKDQTIEPESSAKIWGLRVGLLLPLLLCLFGVIEFFVALMLILLVLFVLRYINIKEIKYELDLNLIVILVCALTLGNALINSGAAELISHLMMEFLKPYGGIGILIGLFLLTVLLTSFVTNVAAVSIAFPIAYSLCAELGLHPTPYYVGIAFAASAAFMTPISYQTNLMVFGPGGYTFKDYFRIGLPLTILYSIVCISFIVLRYNISFE
ncbi:SLC13 family permease [Rapidithrix thailandica]|uniref:SLC13 family permease n=1 Tax=Rapidithrix thailandica TaxID=413964 RepID=A0AAW9SFU5_9BACT